MLEADETFGIDPTSYTQFGIIRVTANKIDNRSGGVMAMMDFGANVYRGAIYSPRGRFVDLSSCARHDNGNRTSTLSTFDSANELAEI